jgi:hypothetical protein
VAMGNALRSSLTDEAQRAIRKALIAARAPALPLVAEHIDWALTQ